MPTSTPSRRSALTYAYMAAGAVICTIHLPVGLLMAPALLLGLRMGKSAGPSLRIGAWALVGSLFPSAVWLAWVAPDAARSDAQGGLIYIFGSVLAYALSLCCTLVCMAHPTLYQALKPLSDEETAPHTPPPLK